MNNLMISLVDVTKEYRSYKNPLDRLKETLSLLGKKYSKQFYALNNVSLDIYKGEIIGLLGKNGSGKSTLLKLITSIIKQTSGEVHVKGSVSALLELGTGFNPELSGYENIYVHGLMSGKSRKEVDLVIEDVIRFADIGEFINYPVKTYSSGMFARLAFAAAINVDPDILIVDEILSVGDMEFQLKCMERMKEMMDKGTTVLFVSHDIHAIKRFCTRAVWLNKGEIIESGNVDAVTDMYLDFIKDEKSIEKIKEKSNKRLIDNFQMKENIIAEIVEFNVLNHRNEATKEVNSQSKVCIDVIYDVYRNVEKPVIGIALRSVDNDYVCGLNTLLDEVNIPWEIGRNKIRLDYNMGLLAIGGKYYFDVAIFEQTATVPIEYLTKVKEIKVNSRYIGEGRYIIPHTWRC